MKQVIMKASSLWWLVTVLLVCRARVAPVRKQVNFYNNGRGNHLGRPYSMSGNPSYFSGNQNYLSGYLNYLSGNQNYLSGYPNYLSGNQNYLSGYPNYISGNLNYLRGSPNYLSGSRYLNPQFMGGGDFSGIINEDRYGIGQTGNLIGYHSHPKCSLSKSFGYRQPIPNICKLCKLSMNSLHLKTNLYQPKSYNRCNKDGCVLKQTCDDNFGRNYGSTRFAPVKEGIHGFSPERYGDPRLNQQLYISREGDTIYNGNDEEEEVTGNTYNESDQGILSNGEDNLPTPILYDGNVGMNPETETNVDEAAISEGGQQEEAEGILDEGSSIPDQQTDNDEAQIGEETGIPVEPIIDGDDGLDEDIIVDDVEPVNETGDVNNPNDVLGQIGYLLVEAMKPQSTQIGRTFMFGGSGISGRPHNYYATPNMYATPYMYGTPSMYPSMYGTSSMYATPSMYANPSIYDTSNIYTSPATYATSGYYGGTGSSLGSHQFYGSGSGSAKGRHSYYGSGRYSGGSSRFQKMPHMLRSAKIYRATGPGTLIARTRLSEDEIDSAETKNIDEHHSYSEGNRQLHDEHIDQEPNPPRPDH